MNWKSISSDRLVNHYIGNGPDSSIWPENLQSFSNNLQEIYSSMVISNLAKSDFRCLLAASYLLSPTKQSISPILFEHIPSPSGIGIPLTWQELERWQWRRIPIPTKNGASGSIFHAILGMSSNDKNEIFYPDWCKTKLDENSRRAVENVFQYVTANNPGKSFFFFPVLSSRVDGQYSVSGESLGLPVYLGCTALLKNIHPPSNIITTGIVTSKGELAEVDGLSEKISAASLKKMAAFIYPNISKESLSGATIDPLQSYDGDTVRVPVSTLEEALLNWLHFAPDHGSELRKFFTMVSSPVLLATNLVSIPSTLIPIPPNLKSEFKSRLLNLTEFNDAPAYDALRALHKSLKSIMDKSGSPQKVRAILELVDDELIESIAHKWEYRADFDYSGCGLAFDFALMRLVDANHNGEDVESTYWYKKANRYWEKKGGINKESRFMLYINNMISIEHNRYNFEAKIPGDILLEDINKVINRIETRYLEDKEENQAVTSFELGCFYGTLMQHYAFCGTEYLDIAIEYSEKAIFAFAGTHEQGPIDVHSRRQYCYQVYAYLDAKKWNSAEKALLIYLGPNIDVFEHIDPLTFKSDYWKQAVLARFMADTGKRLPNYETLLREFITSTQPAKCHPVQLWLYNAGKVVEDNELKISAWKHSVAACFSNPKSVTIPIMALLPLSQIAQNHCHDESYLEENTLKAINAMKHEAISESHFQPLTGLDNWKDVLTQLYENPARYFSFSYR